MDCETAVETRTTFGTSRKTLRYSQRIVRTYLGWSIVGWRFFFLKTVDRVFFSSGLSCSK